METYSGFTGLVGVARQDITPPVGIYCRNWGAAKHDATTGIHRPLTLTALTLQDQAGDMPLLLIDADLGWFTNIRFGRQFLGRLVAEVNLPAERIIFAMTHTHSAPPLTDTEPGWEGGDKLPPYVQKVLEAAATAAGAARESAQPATLEWHRGRCALAANRDLPEGDRIVCGYNPDKSADDTLLVGRVTGDHGTCLATIANYACHPTTLAWQNSLASPDFVGAMRETVEHHTGDAPAMFLQGASGELAPRHQYVGDTAIADSHGRELGYAILAALEAMAPAGHELAHHGEVVESGAPLAVWRLEPRAAARGLDATVRAVELPLKDWPPAAELRRDYEACPDRTTAERLRRKLRIRESLGDGCASPVEIWAWRVGDAVIAGSAMEAYSQHQQRLRARFPERAVAWMNVINGSIGYLPPATLYDEDVYQVWQTPFAVGSLELFTEATEMLVQDLLAGK